MAPPGVSPELRLGVPFQDFILASGSASHTCGVHRCRPYCLCCSLFCFAPLVQRLDQPRCVIYPPARQWRRLCRVATLFLILSTSVDPLLPFEKCGYSV